MSKFGDALREARAAREMSRERFARWLTDETGTYVSQASIESWETGRYEPRFATALVVLKTIGMHLGDGEGLASDVGQRPAVKPGGAGRRTGRGR